jgi:hypothetical protein
MAGTHRFKDKFRAVITEFPFTSGFSHTKNLFKEIGVVSTIKTALYSIKDTIRKTFRMPRQYIVLSSDISGEAKITTKYKKEFEEMKANTSLGGWKNQVSASVLLEIPFYNPISYVNGIRTEVLVVGVNGDQNVIELSKKLRKKQVKYISSSEKIDEIIDIELNFLKNLFK